MPNSTAYWVAPNGKTIDVGTNTHIGYIIDHPKEFKKVRLVAKKYFDIEHIMSKFLIKYEELFNIFYD